MPYKSKNQENFMEGCRENQESMRGHCPDRKTLAKFHRAAKKAGQFKRKGGRGR